MSLRKLFSHELKRSCLFWSLAHLFSSLGKAATLISSFNFMSDSFCVNVARIAFCSLRYLSSCNEYCLSFCLPSHSVFSFINLKVLSFSSRRLLNCWIVLRSYPAFQLL